jgi:hypothetical protein
MLPADAAIQRAIFDRHPHLTVAEKRGLSGEQEPAEVALEFAQASQRCLPIQSAAAQVALMDTRSGRWEIKTTFKLGYES